MENTEWDYYRLMPGMDEVIGRKKGLEYADISYLGEQIDMKKLRLAAFREGLEEALKLLPDIMVHTKEDLQNEAQKTPSEKRGWNACRATFVEAITSRIEESKKGI